LSFLLDKKKPKTLPEAHKMAMQIESSLSMTKTDAMDNLSLMKLASCQTIVKDAQERREQVFSQQNENVIKEQGPEQQLEKDDEVSTIAPPSGKIMQEPVQQSKDEVSSFPLQNSNDTVLLDSKEEEEKEALDKEAVHEDEAPVIIPQPDEALQDLVNPAQDEKMSKLSFDSFDDALFFDSENKKGIPCVS
jgi:hypothetical protein